MNFALHDHLNALKGSFSRNVKSLRSENLGKRAAEIDLHLVTKGTPRRSGGLWRASLILKPCPGRCMGPVEVLIVEPLG